MGSYIFKKDIAKCGIVIEDFELCKNTKYFIALIYTAAISNKVLKTDAKTLLINWCLQFRELWNFLRF